MDGSGWGHSLRSQRHPARPRSFPGPPRIGARPHHRSLLAGPARHRGGSRLLRRNRAPPWNSRERGPPATISGNLEPGGHVVNEVGSPLVEFQDLTVSYGLVQALSGVSGTFPAGPTGLLGPNGAGKTTLLKKIGRAHV